MPTDARCRRRYGVHYVSYLQGIASDKNTEQTLGTGSVYVLYRNSNKSSDSRVYVSGQYMYQGTSNAPPRPLGCTVQLYAATFSTSFVHVYVYVYVLYSTSVPPSTL